MCMRLAIILATLLSCSLARGGALLQVPTCANGALNQFIALSSTGCSIGSFILRDFQYTGITSISADLVTVTLTGDDQALVLDFAGGWKIRDGGSMDFDVLYTIDTIAGFQRGTSFFNIYVSGVALHMWSPRYRGESLFVGSNNFGTGENDNNLAVAYGPNPGLTGEAGFGLFATANGLDSRFGMSRFTEMFIATEPIVSIEPVPEPPSVGLLVLGLLLTVVISRHRMAS
jgi:hypothetical protein